MSIVHYYCYLQEVKELCFQDNLSMRALAAMHYIWHTVITIWRDSLLRRKYIYPYQLLYTLGIDMHTNYTTQWQIHKYQIVIGSGFSITQWPEHLWATYDYIRSQRLQWKRPNASSHRRRSTGILTGSTVLYNHWYNKSWAIKMPFVAQMHTLAPVWSVASAHVMPSLLIVYECLKIY